jgi:ParB family chromosome partitioning protein
MSLNLLDVSPDDLQPNPWNPNRVSAENELKIENSLSELDFYKPLIARELEDGSLQLLGGEHRWRAAKRMGYKKLPVINLGPISDDAAYKITVVDNGSYGDDDPLAMAELLKLVDLDDLKNIVPISDDDLSAIFASSSIAMNDLALLDSEVGSAPALTPETKPAPTHQVMRFKVPVADVAWISILIEKVIRDKAYREKDSLMNAGSALIDIANAARETI